MTAMAEVRDVSHHFGEITALQGINLTIDAGSYAVLLGPSGCGKTTLLSILGGFLQPTSGDVLLNGEPITHVPPTHRPTATMFQDYALFPHINVLDNVAFGLRMKGQSKKQRHEDARRLLKMVDLESSAKKKPHQLSGGQKQRVALARALAVEPAVLLLDEPLAALDLKLKRQMQYELKAIQKRVGTTFIHVTHDQEEAMAIADTLIVMNNGEIEDTGSPESVYLTPRTLFSADFMGEANTIAATVNSVSADSITITTSNGTVSLPASTDVNRNLSVGDKAGLCFRPEHICATDTIGIDTIDLGAATLIDRAFFGSYQRCQVQTEDATIHLLQLPQSKSLTNGQTISLLVPAASVVLLRESQQ